MRLIEIIFWVCLYWAFYLPCAILLHLITEEGDPIGILLVGAIITLVLLIYLLFQDECLFETWETAIVHHNYSVPVKEKSKPLEVKPYVKKEEKPRTNPTPSARPTVGSVGSSMRTDVDLSQLNADDDDLLS